MALVQEANWTNPIETGSSLRDPQRQNSDLICSKHKQKHGSKIALLVHVIDGFIIEESNVPFKADEDEHDLKEIPNTSGNQVPVHREDEKENEVINASLNSYPEDKDELMSLLPTKCKYCGGGLPDQRAMWGKRFCSVSCGKKYSVTCSKRVRRALQRRSTHHSGTDQGEDFTPDTSPIPSKRGRGRGRGRRSSTPARITRESPDGIENGDRTVGFDSPDLHFEFPPRFPLGFGLDTHDIENELYDGVEPLNNYAFIPIVTWSIEQVSEYIRSIPGCCLSAQIFADEEIDGQALMLLNMEHMIHTMNLKLGPALKIAAQLRSVKLEYGIQTKSKYLSSPL